MEDVGLRAKLADAGKFLQDGQRVRREMDGLAETAVRAGRTAANAGKGFGSMLSPLGGLGSVASGVGRGFNAMLAPLSQIGFAVFGVQQLSSAVQGLGQAALGPSQQMENFGVQFETLLGSADAAQAKLDELSTFARKTPFELPQLIDATKQMLAYGFSADEVVPMLERVGDASATLGSDALPRIIRALGQMKARTKVSAQEMLQLTEAGIPAWKMLADAMGVPVGELQDLVTKGVVPADAAITVLLAGMEQRFGGLMERQSQTFGGMLSNLSDWVFRAKSIVGADVFEALKDQLRGLLTTLDTPEVEARLREWGKALGGFARDAIGSLRTGAAIVGNFASLLGRGIEVARAPLTSFGDTAVLVAGYLDQNLGPALQVSAIAITLWAGIVTAQAIAATYRWIAANTQLAISLVRTVAGAAIATGAAIVGALAPIAPVLLGLGIVAGGLYAAWTTDFLGIQGITGRVLNWVEDRIAALLRWLKSLPIIGGGVAWIEGMVQTAGRELPKIVDAARSTVGGVIDEFRNGFPAVQRLIREMFQLPDGTTTSVDPLAADPLTLLGRSGAGASSDIAGAQAALAGLRGAAASGAGGAEAEIRSLRKEVQRLEEDLRSAQEAVRGFSDPRLPGMQQAEDELFALEQAAKRARLEELKLGDAAKEAQKETAESFDLLGAQQRELAEGIPVALQKAQWEAEQARRQAERAASEGGKKADDAPSASDILRKQIEMKRLEMELQFDKQKRDLKEMREDLEGLNKEITFEDAVKGLQEAHARATELEAKLAESKAQLEGAQEALEAQRAGAAGALLDAHKGIARAITGQHEASLLVEASAEQQNRYLEDMLDRRERDNAKMEAGLSFAADMEDILKGQTTELDWQVLALNEQLGTLEMTLNPLVDANVVLGDRTGLLQGQNALIGEQRFALDAVFQVAARPLPEKSWLVQMIEGLGAISRLGLGPGAGLPGSNGGQQVPGLVNGGDVLSSGIVRVGERGPETIFAPARTRVLPASLTQQSRSTNIFGQNQFTINGANQPADFIGAIQRDARFRRITAGRN